MAKQYDPFLVRDSDGQLVDSRIKYGPGDRIRVVRGVLGGLTATVVRVLDQWVIDGRIVGDDRYELSLDNERKITVAWDEVEAV